MSARIGEAGSPWHTPASKAIPGCAGGSSSSVIEPAIFTVQPCPARGRTPTFARKSGFLRAKRASLLNPCSGRIRRHPGLVPAIRAFIARHGLDADLVFTERRGQATDLARAAVADGCEQVVAVGGDGTMNEVAQALVGASAALALVPCGSGNGLASHLGVPAQPRRALALLVDPSARVVNIDTGTANGHPFFNAMGAGFDAEISRQFNRLARRGMVAYLRTGLAAFAHYRGEPVAFCDANGRRETMNAFLVVVANSDQYGNHARMAPGARVDDGLLDLVVVPPPGVAGAVALMARLFLGNFDRSAAGAPPAQRPFRHRTFGARPHPYRRGDPRNRRHGGSRRPPSQPAPRGPGRLRRGSRRPAAVFHLPFWMTGDIPVTSASR